MTDEKRCPTCGHEVTRPLSPAGRLPKTVQPAARIDGLSVVEWHDKPEPVGQPDCVALLLDVGLEGPLVVRLKSRAYCQQVIAALQRHMKGVWP